MDKPALWMTNFTIWTDFDPREYGTEPERLAALAASGDGMFGETTTLDVDFDTVPDEVKDFFGVLLEDDAEGE